MPILAKQRAEVELGFAFFDRVHGEYWIAHRAEESPAYRKLELRRYGVELRERRLARHIAFEPYAS